MKKPKTTSTPEEREAFGARLRKFLKEFGVEQKQLALSGRVSAATISAYLSGQSQPAADIMSNWVRDFKVNANWLLTGQGDMLFTARSPAVTTLPPEETATNLSPTQREMYAYKRLQTELGMPKNRIAEGIEALVRGRLAGSRPLPGPTVTDQTLDDRFDKARGDEAIYDKDT